MQRLFAALVATLLFAAIPALALAGPPVVDAGATDAGVAIDAGSTLDAAAGAPDAGPDAGFFPPALDDGETCDCSASGTPGTGSALLALGVVFALRRRRR